MNDPHTPFPWQIEIVEPDWLPDGLPICYLGVDENGKPVYITQDHTQMHDGTVLGDAQAILKAQEVPTLLKALEDMLFAYVNKDGEFPHGFEVEAVEQAEEILQNMKGLAK